MAEWEVDYLKDKTNIWYGVHGRKERGGGSRSVTQVAAPAGSGGTYQRQGEAKQPPR